MTIAQPLKHDAALGATADGGLTKEGAGTLTLTPVQTFNGGVTVNGGTLVFGSSQQTYAGATTINSGTLKLTNAATLPAGATPSLRFDASNAASVTVDGSNNVSQWADQGSQVNNAVLPSGTVAPTYNPTGLNGKGVVNFASTGATSAGASRLETQANTGISGNSSRTLFTVAARGNGNLFVHTGEQGTTNLAFGTSLEGGNTYYYLWGNDITTGTVQPQGQFVLTSQRYDGAALQGWLNGGLVNTLATTAANTSNSTLQLGSRHNLANNSFTAGNGAVAEVIMYSTALSQADRAAVEAYLNYKWFNVGTTTNLLPATTPVSIGNGGTLDLNGTQQTVASLSGTTGSSVLLGSGALTVNGGASTTFAGAISGTGALTKAGAGTLVLSGANTHTGPTSVDEGTLLVNGSLTGSAVTVTDGGVLGGTGSINTNNQAITLLNGAQLAPGASAGNLLIETGTAQLNLTGAIGSGTGSLAFELGAVGASDKVTLAGTSVLNIGSGLLEFGDFNFTTVAGFTGGTFTLFDSNELIAGSLGSSLTGQIGGFDATLSLGDSNHDVILTVVPEPGTSAILLAGMGLLTGLRRTRRRSA